MLRRERFAISFYIAGGVELPDVTEMLNYFGKVTDLTWATYENTPIKTGEHTAYLDLHENIQPEDIPRTLIVGGYKIPLRHRANFLCARCRKVGHQAEACKKLEAQEQLARKQEERRRARMDLEIQEPKQS